MYGLEQTPILVWFTVGCRSKELFTQKPLGHEFWESLNPQCLRVSHAPPPTLDLHESSFGSQPIASLVNEKVYLKTHMASMQMLIGIVGNSFGTTLLNLWYEFGSTLRVCALQNTLGNSPWASLWSHPKSGVSWAECLWCKHAVRVIIEKTYD